MKASIERLSADPARLPVERLQRLQDLTAALSAAATPGEVAALIFDRGLGLVGASAVTLFWERSPGELELVHGLGLSDEFIQRYRRLGAGNELPSAEAYRTGEPVWLGSLDALRARFPRAAELAEAEGDQAWAAIPLVADRSRGALGLRFDTARAFDAEEREFVIAVSRQCAQALERARLYEAQKRLADRLQALQDVTSSLTGALLPAEVAAVVFRGLLGLGAREVAIHDASPSGGLTLLFGHGVDADEAERLSRARPMPHTDAFRTGEPCWLDSPDAIRAAYPELEEERARRGDGAWIAVPLRMETRSVGVLTLTFPEDRRLREEDRSFVLALAQQGAQALERARLYDGQRRLAERLAQIHSTAAALSGAATPKGVAEAAFRGLAALGANAAEIHALDGPERLVLVARHGAVRAVEGASLSIDLPAPPAEVVRSGKALWLESPEEIEGRFPSLEAEHVARGEAAWAVVPLLAGGETLGALSVSFPRPRRFEADDKAFVRMLAIPCAQALERARLFEAASRHRQEAEWNAATLDAALAAAPVGLAILDREMRFLRVNARLAAIIGVPVEEHLGKQPTDLLPALDAEAVAAPFRRVVESGRASEDTVVEVETLARPGVARRWVLSYYPVRVGGEIVAVGVLVREQRERG